MPCLTAVETCPSIVVGGGDLAGIALGAFMVVWLWNYVLGAWGLSLGTGSYTALGPEILVQCS